jgi:hypothetical protein
MRSSAPSYRRRHVSLRTTKITKSGTNPEDHFAAIDANERADASKIDMP